MAFKKFTIEEFMCRVPNSIKNTFEIVKLHTEHKDKALIKTEYGECLCHRLSLLRGCPPSVKIAVNKNEYFINRAKKVHKDRNYDYSKIEYVNNSTKVKVGCPIHGEFYQEPNSHLSGNGCPKCGNNIISKSRRENPSSWTLYNWENSAEKSKDFDSFKVYIIECWNDEERFFKIGRTYHTVGRRFRNSRSIPYKWKLIKEIEGDSDTIFNLENELKKENKIFKYTPKLKFCGMHECFSEINTNGK